MNTQELRQHLEIRRRELSDKEFFTLILGKLENDLTQETREVLEFYLLAYSYIDEERVARYLEQFLYDSQNLARVEFAMLELFTLAKASNSLAYRIIDNFSGAGLQKTKKDTLKVEKPSSGDTNRDDFEQYFETRRNELSEKEFFELILHTLENDPPKETREVLESYFLRYAFVDKDRVTRYLEKLLSSPHQLKREFAVLELFTLASEPDSLAYKILTIYLGTEPTIRIIMERLLKTFPHHK